MRPELETYEYIDRYLSGDLSQQEQEAFEQRMQEDPGFAETVEDQKLTNEIIFDKGQIDLKKQIRKDLYQQYHGTAGTGSNLRKILFAGAGLLLAGMASWYFISDSSTDQNSVENKDTAALAKQDTNQQSTKAPSHTTPPASSEGKTSQPENKNTRQTPASSAPQKQNGESTDNPDKSKTPKPEKEQIPADTVPEDKDTVNNQKQEKPKVPDPPLPRYKEEEDTLTRKSATGTQQDQDSTANPCKDISLKTGIQTKTSCPGKAGGSIRFKDNIEEGQPPYRFSVNNGKDFSEKDKYTGLKPGSYKVAVKDQQGCTSQWIVNIDTKNCTETYSINTAHNETWDFPVSDDKNATVEIINRSGMVVYQTQITNGYPREWDGTGNNGQQLEPGNYIFLIKYEDGTRKKGNINLIR